MICYAIVCGALVALYLYATRTFKFWEERGVKYEKPVPFFGSISDILFGKVNVVGFIERMYWKYPNDKIVGIFRSSYPDLLIRDPDLIKRVWSTDFHSFYARGIFNTDGDYQSIEILRRNLLVVEGDVWRLLKQASTSAFSSSKLKAMFPLIAERTARLQQRVRRAAAARRVLDARELMARYTTDFIGACGLGIDADTLNDEQSAFRQLGAKIFSTSKIKVITFLLKTMFPYAFKNAKLHYTVEKEFCELVTGILKRRNYKPSGRYDFIDFLLEIREKGRMECKSTEKTRPDGSPDLVSMELDDELMAAQVFLFFAAGFETSASATSYTLHEIAYNPEEQRKIQADIDSALANHGNQLTYDSVKEMHYLEWAFKEGMRIRPSVGALSRVCRQKYTFEDLGLTIGEGTRVTISPQGMHHDPKYWDRPEEFRPERFSPEINEPKHKFAYLPFGAGPRACIGERLSTVQSLAGLAAILSQFSVAPAPTSTRHPKQNPKAFLVQGATMGLPLLFTPRTIHF